MFLKIVAAEGTGATSSNLLSSKYPNAKIAGGVLLFHLDFQRFFQIFNVTVLFYLKHQLKEKEL